jgi:hypothetical protein
MNNRSLLDVKRQDTFYVTKSADITVGRLATWFLHGTHVALCRGQQPKPEIWMRQNPKTRLTEFIYAGEVPEFDKLPPPMQESLRESHENGVRIRDGFHPNIAKTGVESGDDFVNLVRAVEAQGYKATMPKYVRDGVPGKINCAEAIGFTPSVQPMPAEEP